MHSSIESYGTRTLLELSVGKTHTIDVLIHLRTNDEIESYHASISRKKGQNSIMTAQNTIVKTNEKEDANKVARSILGSIFNLPLVTMAFKLHTK